MTDGTTPLDGSSAVIGDVGSEGVYHTDAEYGHAVYFEAPYTGAM